MQLDGGHAFPFGLEARCRDVTHGGKAPPSPEMTISGLTRGQVFGRMIVAKQIIFPALPDVRPAPQAGCFVSRLYASCESQVVCDSFAFGTAAIAPSRSRQTPPNEKPKIEIR